MFCGSALSTCIQAPPPGAYPSLSGLPRALIAAWQAVIAARTQPFQPISRKLPDESGGRN